MLGCDLCDRWFHPACLQALHISLYLPVYLISLYLPVRPLVPPRLTPGPIYFPISPCISPYISLCDRWFHPACLQAHMPDPYP